MNRIYENHKFQMSKLNPAKAGSNQIQSSKEMPKQVRHDKGVILNSFQNPTLYFDIHLVFGPALAGLTFDIELS